MYFMSLKSCSVLYLIRVKCLSMSLFVHSSLCNIRNLGASILLTSKTLFYCFFLMQHTSISLLLHFAFSSCKLAYVCIHGTIFDIVTVQLHEAYICL